MTEARCCDQRRGAEVNRRMLALARGWQMETIMMRNPVPACALVLSVALWAGHCAAHELSRSECAEGGEFIRNAALARDAGVTRDFFVGKLTEDLVLIQSFPPHLRWFVQDSGDEQLLSEAVFRVFDAPMPAAEHESEFVVSCLQASASRRKGI